MSELRRIERANFGIEAQGGLAGQFRRIALAASGLGELARIREEARAISDPFELADFTLRELGVAMRAESAVTGADIAQAFPVSGPLVVVANHPFGGVDGLAALATVAHARRDLRLLANPELMQIEGLRPLVIPLDPFGNKTARVANSAALRAALRWLRDGGALMIFPAGEVSHFTLRNRSITDGDWHPTAARIIRHAGATVSPLFFAGHNSWLFQLAGLVHPRLRTFLLPSEMARRAGSTLDIRIGAPLDARSLAPFSTDEALTAHLRLKTYVLGSTPGPAPKKPLAVATSSTPASGVAMEARELEPLAPAVAPELLAEEIAALPRSATLVAAGDQLVICAAARLIPNTLQELGRLRELSFRAVGEGTGHRADIDVFDDYYEHLFVWNSVKREIVGAYRLGRVDEIRRRFGTRGLYTSTLFDYHEPFLTLLGAALELGRSFVRPEHQRSFASLLLLWKGIGAYIGRNPQYARLIGPVSISDSYSTISKELLVRYLRARNFDHFGATLVKAKCPFRHPKALRSLGLDIGTMPDLDVVSSLVAGLEADRKGVPVLLRQYLKLGGRLLGFNVDGDFNDAIDCLLVIDLRQTDARMLRKYLSEEALTRFAQAHRIKSLQDDAAA